MMWLMSQITISANMSFKGRGSFTDFNSIVTNWIHVDPDLEKVLRNLHLHRAESDLDSFGNSGGAFYENLIDVEFLQENLKGFSFAPRNLHPDFAKIIKKNYRTRYSKALIWGDEPCEDEKIGRGFWNGPSGSCLLGAVEGLQDFMTHPIIGNEFAFGDCFSLNPTGHISEGNYDYENVMNFWGDHFQKNKIQLVLTVGGKPLQACFHHEAPDKNTPLLNFGKCKPTYLGDKLSCGENSTAAFLVIAIPHPGWVVNHAALGNVSEYDALYFELLEYSLLNFFLVLSEMQRKRGNDELLTFKELCECLTAAKSKLKKLNVVINEKRTKLSNVSGCSHCVY